MDGDVVLAPPDHHATLLQPSILDEHKAPADTNFMQHPVVQTFSFPEVTRRSNGPVPGSPLFAALCLRLVILPLIAALAFEIRPTADEHAGTEILDDASASSIENDFPLTPEQPDSAVFVQPSSREASDAVPIEDGLYTIEQQPFEVNAYPDHAPLPPMDMLGPESPPIGFKRSKKAPVNRQKSIQRQEEVRTELGIETIPSGYTYTNFENTNSFRLLFLTRNDNPSGLITCTLTDYDMHSPHRPPYRALSYTWGQVHDRELIIINGRPAYVTSNLHSALQVLQQSNDTRGLWVDALCINQADPDERTHQVSQMRDIFGNAEQVIAWIGNESTDSQLVISTMRTGWEEANKRCSILGRMSREYETYASSLLQANCSFFIRPYWTRAWIIQELVVAKDVLLMCGRDSATWTEFESYVMTFRSHGSKVMGRPPDKLRKVINERMKLLMLKELYQARNHDLSTLISASASTFATDPRDKIFALLGLIGHGHALRIEPDYTLSPCAVFCKAIRSMFRDEFAGAQANERTLEAVKLMEYFQRKCPHNPFDSKTIGLGRNCDGVGCQSREMCFAMPGLLGKTGIIVPQRFYQVQLLTRSAPLK